MSLANRAFQSVSRLVNGDQMNVIWHQTICPDLDLVGAGDDIARQRLVTTLVKQGQVDGSKVALGDAPVQSMR